MAGNFSKVDDFPEYLKEISDAKLEETARDYIWLSEVGPEAARDNYTPRRDMIVAECERRGKSEIVERARRRAQGK